MRAEGGGAYLPKGQIATWGDTSPPQKKRSEFLEASWSTPTQFEGEDAVNRGVKLVLWAACCLGFAATGYGQETLECQTDGQWTIGPVISGAVCRAASSSDLYRIDFARQTGAFAPHVAGAGELRFLQGTDGVLFYADDRSIYALDSEHYRVIWHQSWDNIRILPKDPFDAQHLAFLSGPESDLRFHVIRTDAGQILEDVSTPVEETPVRVEWFENRLVVFLSGQMLIWERPQAQGEDAVWAYPDVVFFDTAVDASTISVDASGVMVFDTAGRRLSYYRFELGSWTRAAINATATIRGIGASDKHAMGVTSDASTVRIVARMGAFLQNRFEAKYWKLSQDPRHILVTGQEDLVALDGGTDNRALIIDTTEMTWKRVALINYPAPGAIAELSLDALTTLHDDGESALIVWNARTGEKVVELARNRVEALGMGPIERVETIRENPRFKILYGQNGQFALFDQTTQGLSAAVAGKWSPWSTRPENLRLVGDRIVLSAEGQPSTWQVYGGQAGEAGQIPMQTLSPAGYRPEQFEELQSPREKWYGYCIAEDDCFVPGMAEVELKRAVPDVEVLPAVSHKPTWVSWGIALLSLFAMIGVMLWRRGVGRKSLLESELASCDQMTSCDIYDSQHRRFIEDRDVKYFLSPTFFSTPAFRLTLSFLLALGVGIFLSLAYFYDDSLVTFLSWVVVLGLPVMAATWIALSWTYWDRYFLLRFGCFTEGKWQHCAQKNQSIAYSPTSGQSFELTRNQWRRVDLVPLVVFDPANPRFAIQYTGVCSHTILPATGKIADKPTPARPCDLRSLAGVIALLVVMICSTQWLFRHAYPDPMSAWTLNTIATQHEGGAFTLACLERCGENKTCHEQCHRRQLANILNDAGVEVENRLATTPAQFLQAHRDNVSQARAILQSPDMSCRAKTAELLQIPLWPEPLRHAFQTVYADQATFDAAHLSDIRRGLDEDRRWFEQLCNTTCASHSEQCPEPPQCQGNSVELRSVVCAFQNAL